MVSSISFSSKEIRKRQIIPDLEIRFKKVWNSFFSFDFMFTLESFPKFLQLKKNY